MAIGIGDLIFSIRGARHRYPETLTSQLVNHRFKFLQNL